MRILGIGLATLVLAACGPDTKNRHVAVADDQRLIIVSDRDQIGEGRHIALVHSRVAGAGAAARVSRIEFECHGGRLRSLATGATVGSLVAARGQWTRPGPDSPEAAAFRVICKPRIARRTITKRSVEDITAAWRPTGHD